MKRVCISGYFDPLHVGHLEYIERAKALGDYLVVIVNNDLQAALKKGKAFMPCEERAKLVAQLRNVDEVVIAIDQDRTVNATLRSLEPKPDMFCNGGDQTNHSIPECEACTERGIDLVDGLGAKIQSSSWLIAGAKSIGKKEGRAPRVVGIIPARYGSTRFPGKPLMKIAGKPMIQCTYESASKSKLLTDLVVATDDERIAEVVKGFGGKVVMTSSSCANGSMRCWEALKQIRAGDSYDLVVNIQGDEPLVSADHIDNLITVLWEAPPEVKMGATAAPISNEDDLRCLAVTKVVMDQYHNALYFSRAMIPHSKSGEYHGHGQKSENNLAENTSQIYYKNCGMYAFRRAFLGTFAQAPSQFLQGEEDLEQLKALELGEKIRMAVVDHAEGGIDLPEQLEALNQRLQQN